MEDSELTQSIPSTNQNVNSHSSVGDLPTKSIKLSDSENRRRVARLHAEAEKFAIEQNLTHRQKSILHEYVNRIDHKFQSRSSQESMARFFTCSVDTLQREIKKLKEAGAIEIKRRGRLYDKATGKQINQTNITTLIFLKTKLTDGYRNLRCDLTPPSTREERRESFETPLPSQIPEKEPPPSRLLSKEEIKALKMMFIRQEYN